MERIQFRFTSSCLAVMCLYVDQSRCETSSATVTYGDGWQARVLEALGFDGVSVETFDWVNVGPWTVPWDDETFYGANESESWDIQEAAMCAALSE